MDPECKDITKIVLPAVRASLAETMHTKYGYTQEEIAKRIGVVQVAVSKYLRKRNSKEITRMKEYIIKNGLNEDIVGRLIHGESGGAVDKAIDALCEKLVAVNIA